MNRFASLLILPVALVAVILMSCDRSSKSKSTTVVNKAPPVVPAAPISKVLPTITPSPGSRRHAEDQQSNTTPIPSVPASNQIRFDNGITAVVDTGDDRVMVEATVISGQSRPLEYLVVTIAGAEHEALLSMTGRASDLKKALELLGLREGKRKLQYRGDPQTPDGSPVSIEVRWKDSKGKELSTPIEDWIWNAQTEKPMERSHWIFTGSDILPSAGSRRGSLAADNMGNVVAIWHDPSCVIDNPRKSASDDRNWFPNSKAGIPHAGTEVTLILRSAKLPIADKSTSTIEPPVPTDKPHD